MPDPILNYRISRLEEKLDQLSIDIAEIAFQIASLKESIPDAQALQPSQWPVQGELHPNECKNSPPNLESSSSRISSLGKSKLDSSEQSVNEKRPRSRFKKIR